MSARASLAAWRRRVLASPPRRLAAASPDDRSSAPSRGRGHIRVAAKPHTGKDRLGRVPAPVEGRRAAAYARGSSEGRGRYVGRGTPPGPWAAPGLPMTRFVRLPQPGRYGHRLARRSAQPCRGRAAGRATPARRHRGRSHASAYPSADAPTSAIWLDQVGHLARHKRGAGGRRRLPRRRCAAGAPWGNCGVRLNWSRVLRTRPVRAGLRGVGRVGRRHPAGQRVSRPAGWPPASGLSARAGSVVPGLLLPGDEDGLSARAGSVVPGAARFGALPVCPARGPAAGPRWPGGARFGRAAAVPVVPPTRRGTPARPTGVEAGDQARPVAR
jgi:hypothetical protein